MTSSHFARSVEAVRCHCELFYAGQPITLDLCLSEDRRMLARAFREIGFYVTDDGAGFTIWKPSDRAPSTATERQLDQVRCLLDKILWRFRAWVPAADDLEDCRASVLSRAWRESLVRQLVDENRLSELSAWLYRCVRNELLNKVRSQRRERDLWARSGRSDLAPSQPLRVRRASARNPAIA